MSNYIDKIHLQWFADEPAEPTNEPVKEEVTLEGNNGKAENKLNIELIKEEITKNEAFKNNVFKLFAPDIDSRVSKGINTYKTNYDAKMKEEIDLKIEELYQQRHPGEDPKDKLIRQANAKAEEALKKATIQENAKHLLAQCTEIGIKLDEDTIDLLANFKREDGESIISKLNKMRIDSMEEGKNKILNKHAKMPQTGDSVTGEIPLEQLVDKWKKGEISDAEYERRVNKATRR